MRRKTFAGRLSLKIIIITSLIFLLANLLIAVRGGMVAKRSAMDYSVQTLLTSSNGIEAMFNSVEKATQSMAKTIEAFNHNGYQLDTTYFFPLLEDMLNHSPHILGCGVYFAPYQYEKNSKFAGVYVNRDSKTGEIEIEWDDEETFAKDGWDYFTTDWYRDVVLKGEPLWIPPFVEYMVTTDYRYMTTYSVPLMDKHGEYFGVCAFDISLDWLQEELLDMRPFAKSNVIIIDSKGDFICNPLLEKPYEGNIYDIPYLKESGLSGNILEAIEWEDEGKVKSLSINKLDLFCVARTLDNGWIMIISNHYSDAFQNVIQVWVLLALIAILGLIVLFFVSRSTIHKESLPLTEFAMAAGKITNGHFDVPIPQVRYEDEISELGNALRFMQTSVTKYIEELTITTSEKERLAGELNVAKKIQMQMLSQDFPHSKDYGIFASSLPARQVGGDLYDFYIKGDNLYYIIADVSGKGVPAALLMSISIAAFRASIKNDHSVPEIVSVVNNVFCRSNEDSMFITVNIGRINVLTGEMEVCNAGHNPMVLISPEGEAEFVRLNNNLACGIMPEFQFCGQSVKVKKGSRLLFYTDGVTEAEDANHSQYGEERLLAFAKDHGSSQVTSDKSVVKNLIASVNGFVDGAEQFDDITVMSITL